jgi:hypothetical protein
LELEIVAVFFPPRIVVPPAKPLTKTVRTKASMLVDFRRPEFMADTTTHPKSHSYVFPRKRWGEAIARRREV